MESLEISQFKAFDEAIEIKPGASRKNVLLFGENGSGKSSVFEAVKLVFFHDDLLRPHVSVGVSPEQKTNEKETFYTTYYGHRGRTGTAQKLPLIKMNGQNFEAFSSEGYQCFMLSNDNLRYVKSIVSDDNVKDLDEIRLRRIYSGLFYTQLDLDDVLANKIPDVVQLVKESLKDDFFEDVVVGVDVDDLVYIHDMGRNIRETVGLRNVFNEAKINLVLILLFLSLVRVLEAPDAENKRKLLVLDDLVTSLDAENRLYFIRYILRNFNAFQIVVLTHNVGFNNLFEKVLRDQNEQDKWSFLNMYLTSLCSKIYDYKTIKKADDIFFEYQAGTFTPETVGVEIRKRFEADIYELAKLIQLDATTAATEIVANIVHKNHESYLLIEGKKIKSSNDLVAFIRKVLRNRTSAAVKIITIKNEIERYTSSVDIVKLRDFVKEFEFYEKLIIHSLAHGTNGIPKFYEKEVMASVALLRQLEDYIKDVKLKL